MTSFIGFQECPIFPFFTEMIQFFAQICYIIYRTRVDILNGLVGIIPAKQVLDMGSIPTNCTINNFAKIYYKEERNDILLVK
jgi:hypothetical protein